MVLLGDLVLSNKLVVYDLENQVIGWTEYNYLVLSNKLVVYDLENQVIGWTEYNCSSSIKIKDEQTGATYTVDAHNISSGWRFHWQKHLAVLLVTMVYSYLIF
ncbi:hypothetical protein OsJ_14309 [Oryza sativa Japonica Group]|uniref:Peptidase A1 domain-containing protein n=1 Tax=Oryza sativa subsp. japonica TaxID=39947 RepID=A3ASH1_ORYSJ|nr:hypothetical protein OsJ_14309 [Oryza sativa Japonica Group]